MKPRVKFLKSSGPYLAGQILEYIEGDEEIAAWIADGTCEPVATDPSTENKTAPEPKKVVPVTVPDPATAQLKSLSDRVDALERENKQLKRAAARSAIGEVKVSQPDDPAKPFGYTCLSEYMLDAWKVQRAGGTPSPKFAAFDAHCKASGLQTMSDADGGALIPDNFLATLLNNVRTQSRILPLCRQIPIQRNVTIPVVNETSRATGSRYGGVQVYRVAEAATYTSSKPAFRQLRLELNKVTGLCYLTDELMRDSPISVGPIVNDAFAQEFAWTLDNDILRGTGAGQPLGVLNAGSLVSFTRTTTSHIDYLDVIGMHARLWVYSQGSPGLRWLVNQDTFPDLHKLQIALGTAAQPVWMPPGALAVTPYSTLLGIPVIPVEQCSTLGTVGDIVLCDFQQYIYSPESSGMTSATSEHLRFLFDETAIKFTLRYDGRPLWNSALTPANGSNTVSPFVALAT